MKAKLLATAAALLLSGVAHAGGPLYVFDPANQIPYAWSGTVPVYTDLGALGGMNHEQADGAVAFAFGQWTSVATSSFEAAVVGDFGSIGLPDITGANAYEIVGADNGGGLHVIYDSDGTVISDFFGAGYGVLGIASPEYAAAEDSPVLVEGWAVINGDVIPDPASITWVDVIAEFTGVMTHEFGHAINLAHTQVNGPIALLYYDGELGVPGSCDPSAIGWAYPSVDDVETMYPYISPGFSGTAQSTVDVLDDVAALSNLYPAAGWLANRGTISGEITLPDGETPVLGVNVVARNVADPFRDAVSALSGDYTQGALGSDGRYRLNGLTPGADYVLFIEGILAGGFSTPYGILPGPEEYWNGADESGDATLDASCAYQTIQPAPGSPFAANIAFNANPDAPQFTPLTEPWLIVTDLSQQGDEMVGGVMGAPIGFRYSKTRGYEYFLSQLAPVISGNGQKVGATQYFGYPELSWAGYWDGGADPSTLDDDRWQLLEPMPGSLGCDLSLTSIWDLSRDGSVAVGHNWFNCTDVQAFRWDAATGMVQLPKAWETSRNTRANTVSNDGRVVAGHEEIENGWWSAVIWRDGVPQILEQEADWWGFYDRFPVGDVWDLNRDGSVAVGENAIGSAEDGYPNSAWRWSADRGLEVLGYIPCPPWSWFCFGGSASSTAVSDDGSVVVGWGGDFSEREATIWTRGLGLRTLEEFLQAQGVVSIDGWALATATDVSGTGNRIGGWGVYGGNVYGWMVEIDKVNLCHNNRTVEVAFPGGAPAPPAFFLGASLQGGRRPRSMRSRPQSGAR